jgi:hypothetical protein
MTELGNRKLYLTPTQTKVLFGYYFLILVSSFICATFVFVPGSLSGFGYIELSLIGSSAMACLGSAVFYLRKLYKAVLSDSLITEKLTENLKQSATFVYFSARPLFSIAFSLLLVIGMKSGLILSGATQSGLGYGFVQLTMFFSFFVGFLSGRFVRQLESWGEKMIERISESDTK